MLPESLDCLLQQAGVNPALLATPLIQRYVSRGTWASCRLGRPTGEAHIFHRRA